MYAIRMYMCVCVCVYVCILYYICYDANIASSFFDTLFSHELAHML